MNLKSVTTFGLALTLFSTSSLPAFAAKNNARYKRQALPAAITVGLAIKEIGDQIEQAIESAKNAGLTIEMEAGREANIALENLKNVYSDSLNETMEKFRRERGNSLDQIKSMVDEMSSNAITSLDDFTAKSQQIVNSLPFRPHEPQLTKILPRFVVPSSTPYPVQVQLSGNFEMAAKSGFTASLLLGNKVYMPSANTTQSLTFIVPLSDLFPPASISSPSNYSVASGTVKVPWQSSSFLGLRHKKHVDEYKVMFGALPLLPGKIQLTHTTSHTERHTKHFTSQEFYQTSASDGGNDDHKDVPYSIHPESGWHVVRSTSSFNETWHVGDDRSHSFISDDGDVVIYKATTIHHRFGTSSQMKFNIGFDEYQDVPVPDTSTESVVLKWGDSKSFDYPATTWRLIFDSFNGSHTEFTGSDVSNPFIKIKNEGGLFVIYTADPKSLQWP